MTSPEAGGALKLSHSGHRYVLGYGADFFGIWDRELPGGPVHTYPRTDEGWAEAWERYSSLEPRGYEIGSGEAPAASGRPLLRFRSAELSSRWAIALVLVVAALSMIGIAFSVRHLALAAGWLPFGISPFRRLQQSQEAVNNVLALGYLAVLPAGIAWLIWQHRAHSNLPALGAVQLRHSPRWAVIWWLLPFANVVLPFTAVRELWKASLPGPSGLEWKLEPTPLLLVAWWAGWLTRIALLSLGGSIGGPLLTADEIVVRSWLLIGGQLATVVTAVLAVRVIRGIQARQAASVRREGLAEPASR